MIILYIITYVLSLPEDKMLELVNKFRKSNNMSYLYPLMPLQKAAELQARHMCMTRNFTHKGSDDRTLSLDNRLRIFDFVGENIGENIAKQEGDDVSEVFRMWKESPNGHSKNLLGDYTYTGLASCLDDYNNRYWVQVFGKDVSNGYIKYLREQRTNGCTEDYKEESPTEKSLADDLKRLIKCLQNKKSEANKTEFPQNKDGISDPDRYSRSSDAFPAIRRRRDGISDEDSDFTTTGPDSDRKPLLSDMYLQDKPNEKFNRPRYQVKSQPKKYYDGDNEVLNNKPDEMRSITREKDYFYEKPKSRDDYFNVFPKPYKSSSDVDSEKIPNLIADGPKTSDKEPKDKGLGYNLINIAPSEIPRLSSIDTAPGKSKDGRENNEPSTGKKQETPYKSETISQLYSKKEPVVSEILQQGPRPEPELQKDDKKDEQMAQNIKNPLIQREISDLIKKEFDNIRNDILKSLSIKKDASPMSTISTSTSEKISTISSSYNPKETLSDKKTFSEITDNVIRIPTTMTLFTTLTKTLSPSSTSIQKDIKTDSSTSSQSLISPTSVGKDENYKRIPAEDVSNVVQNKPAGVLVQGTFPLPLANIFPIGISIPATSFNTPVNPKQLGQILPVDIQELPSEVIPSSAAPKEASSNASQTVTVYKILRIKQDNGQQKEIPKNMNKTSPNITNTINCKNIADSENVPQECLESLLSDRDRRISYNRRRNKSNIEIDEPIYFGAI